MIEKDSGGKKNHCCKQTPGKEKRENACDWKKSKFQANQKREDYVPTTQERGEGTVMMCRGGESP